MRRLLLMAAVFLYVDQPVASLQFDIVTTGTISLDSSVQQKQLAWSDLQGFKRVIVYGLNQLTFDGRFAEVTADVSEIRNAVGASPSGAPVSISVTRLSKPKSVRVERQ